MTLRKSALSVLLISSMLCSCQPQASTWGSVPEVSRAPDEDVFFEPTKESFTRLREHAVSFDCAKLPEYVAANDPWAAYYALRDAGLVLDEKCSLSIRAIEPALEENATTRLALDFYRARLGSPSSLTALLGKFDEEAMQSPAGPSVDHVVVSLLGFFPDWSQTGRRLLRHAKYADGAAATMSGNALEWKKHLYGSGEHYLAECTEAAVQEGIGSKAKTLCDASGAD